MQLKRFLWCWSKGEQILSFHFNTKLARRMLLFTTTTYLLLRKGAYYYTCNWYRKWLINGELCNCFVVRRPTGWKRGNEVVVILPKSQFSMNVLLLLLNGDFLAINAHSMAGKCNEQRVQKTGRMSPQVQCLLVVCSIVQIWRSFCYQQDVSPW